MAPASVTRFIVAARLQAYAEQHGSNAEAGEGREMLVQDLLQATIDERELEIERLRLEREARPRTEAGGQVQFLTNAARVLTTVARDPGATIREIASRVGQTERAVWEQLQKLEGAGLLSRERTGRRNRYQVDQAAVERQLLTEGSALLGSA